MPSVSSISAVETDDLAELSQLLKGAGDPLRLQILQVLQHNAFGVLELCQIFDIRQSAMSHHLKVLAGAGLVATRREGTTIFYRRNPTNPAAELRDLQHSLFQTLDKSNEDPVIESRVAEVNRERAAASLAFFRQNADRLKGNQDLIANWSDYGESVEKFLEACGFNPGTALEIGPGYGEFLGWLSPRFDKVIALDNSAEMLVQCRARIADQQLTNIQFEHGDTQHALAGKIKADCISLNMVLHHNASPAKIIEDCSALLAENGVLLITDLCTHDQDWVRQACGDLWLGLQPEEVSRWAQEAGLIEGDSLYLAQRNGFRIQLRQFLKPSNA